MEVLPQHSPIHNKVKPLVPLCRKTFCLIDNQFVVPTEVSMGFRPVQEDETQPNECIEWVPLNFETGVSWTNWLCPRNSRHKRNELVVSTGALKVSVFLLINPSLPIQALAWMGVHREKTVSQGSC
jgi:hypothetical protein